MNPIVITIQSGIVTEIEGLLDDTEVIIKDYDTQGGTVPEDEVIDGDHCEYYFIRGLTR